MYLDGDIVCLVGPMNGIVLLQNNCQRRSLTATAYSEIGQEDAFTNHCMTEEEMDLEVLLW